MTGPGHYEIDHPMVGRAANGEPMVRLVIGQDGAVDVTDVPTALGHTGPETRASHIPAVVIEPDGSQHPLV